MEHALKLKPTVIPSSDRIWPIAVTAEADRADSVRLPNSYNPSLFYCSKVQILRPKVCFNSRMCVTWWGLIFSTTLLIEVAVWTLEKVAHFTLVSKARSSLDWSNEALDDTIKHSAVRGTGGAGGKAGNLWGALFLRGAIFSRLLFRGLIEEVISAPTAACFTFSVFPPVAASIFTSAVPHLASSSTRNVTSAFLLPSGLVTNSILFCWLFKIKDWCKKVRFLQTHIEGLHQLLLTVSWDLRA